MKKEPRTGKSLGDPNGRRLAMHRALVIAEAEKVCQLLKILLVRANEPSDVCAQLIEQLKRSELRELQRSQGRIEPRKRFKGGSPHPLLEGRELNHLFIDESGISAVEKSEKPQFFSLGAVAMSENSVDFYCRAASEVKIRFFGTDQMTFHEPGMRQHDGPYWFDGDKAKQEAFDLEMEKLIADTPFVAFGVGVRKEPFERDFVQTGLDPYLPTDVYAVAITMLLERYVDYIAVGRSAPTKRGIGRITFESIGPREDAHRQLEISRLMLDGSQWLAASAFQGYLESGCRFQPKCGSHPTELADIVSRELYEWMRSGCTKSPKYWQLLNTKVYCRGDRQCGTFGYKLFPDSDIRDKVEAHRSVCGAIEVTG